MKAAPLHLIHTQTSPALGTRAAVTVDVHTTQGRPLGRVTYRSGIVRPGELAAVRIPGYGLVLRRLYHEGGAVRLVSLVLAIAPLCVPLAGVEILGEVVDCFNAEEGEAAR